jgi:hypothetical protein
LGDLRVDVGLIILNVEETKCKVVEWIKRAQDIILKTQEWVSWPAASKDSSQRSYKGR